MRALARAARRLAVALFLIVFGVLAIPVATTAAWVGAEPEVLLS